MIFDIQRFNNQAYMYMVPSSSFTAQARRNFGVHAFIKCWSFIQPNGSVQCAGTQYSTAASQSTTTRTVQTFFPEKDVSTSFTPKRLIYGQSSILGIAISNSDVVFLVDGGGMKKYTNSTLSGEPGIFSEIAYNYAYRTDLTYSGSITKSPFFAKSNISHLFNSEPSASAYYVVCYDGSIYVMSTSGNSNLIGSPNDFTRNKWFKIAGLEDVINIAPANGAVLFLLADGSIKYLSITASYGLTITSTPTAYNTDFNDTIQLSCLQRTSLSFFFLRADGSVYSLGTAHYNGSSSNTSTLNKILDNVIQMTSSYSTIMLFLTGSREVYGIGWKPALGLVYDSTGTVSTSSNWQDTPRRLHSRVELGCVGYQDVYILRECGDVYHVGKTMLGNETTNSANKLSHIRRLKGLTDIVKCVHVIWSSTASSANNTTFYLKNDGTVYFTGYIGMTTNTYYETVQTGLYRFKTDYVSKISDISAGQWPAQVLFMIKANGDVMYLIESTSYCRITDITSSAVTKVPTLANGTYSHYITRITCIGTSPYAIVRLNGSSLTMTYGPSTQKSNVIDLVADNTQAYGLLENGTYWKITASGTMTQTTPVYSIAVIRDGGYAVTTDHKVYCLYNNTMVHDSDLTVTEITGMMVNTTYGTNYLLETTTGNLIYKKGATNISNIEFFRRDIPQLPFSSAGGNVLFRTLANQVMYTRAGTYTANTSTAASKLTPVPNYVPVPFIKVVAASASGTTSVTAPGAIYYLTKNGDVYYSGAAYWGRSSSTTTITQITELSNIVDISASNAGALFLDIDGNVWAVCPNAASTQYVIGQTTRSTTPVKIWDAKEQDEPAMSIFSTPMRSWIIDTYQTVRAAGAGANYALGTGSTTNLTSMTPINLPNGLNDFCVQIAGSYQHTLFLDDDGHIWVVGSNASGKTGTGSTSGSTTTTTILTITDDNGDDVFFTQIAASYYNSWALDQHGYLYSCGTNSYSGNSSTSGSTTTFTRVTTDIKFREIRAMWQSVWAISEAGTIYTAGSSSYNGTGSNINGILLPLSKYEPRADISLYSSSYIKDRCNEMYETLPNDLKAIINSKKYYYNQISTDGADRSSLGCDCDPIWIPSLKEMGITTGPTGSSYRQETFPSMTSNAARTLSNQTGTSYGYWTRDIVPGNLRKAYSITSGGAQSTGTGNTSKGLMYCFSIGSTNQINEHVPKTLLNSCSWEEISQKSLNGTGDLYWDVGDTKEIILNGNIGSCLTLSNQKLSVFILHFNYTMNGTAENNIIWGGFKSGSVDVALVDSKYNTGSMDGTVCFNMNHTGTASSGNGNYGTNYGGWKGTDFRYDILGATSTAPSEYNQLKSKANVGYDATVSTLTNPKADTLLAALPSDFRSALRLWTRWVDAKGNKSNTEAGIEATVDAVTLLAEYEVFGSRTYANQYEQNHQSQLDYYKAGNGKIRYGHNDTSTAIMWWECSPNCNNELGFCRVSASGSAGGTGARYSSAVAPAFKT